MSAPLVSAEEAQQILDVCEACATLPVGAVQVLPRAEHRSVLDAVPDLARTVVALHTDLAAHRAAIREYFAASTALNATHHERVLARSAESVDAALAAHNAALARFQDAERALRSAGGLG